MKSFISFLLAILFLSTSCQKIKNQEIYIIPQPQQVNFGTSLFSFDTNTMIVFSTDENLRQQVVYFSELIDAAFGFKIEAIPAVEGKSKNSVSLVIVDDLEDLGEEGYKIKIEKNNVLIEANSPKGTFYGLQSLFQLLASNTQETKQNAIEIPTLEIIDFPRFKYRGMHLDVCRHMFPVEFVKKYIDLLALYKFNTFHWHLTEDQGWRIEIMKYPKLTETGSWRKETLIGHGGKKPFKYDAKPYGGFYTQEEIREIVDYASNRQITIIPEIEMPGHSLAALASYPELACTSGPFEVAKRWGVFKDIYCTKDETFVFIENVLLEVMEMFPSKYIHIGGDEAPKARWKECSTCQGVIEREGLKDEHELQSYFIQRIEKFLNKNGRSIIGWDEILEGGLAPNATVMSWRGTEGGIAAARLDHDAIMTPGSHCYFDHYQSNPDTEPLAIGGYTTLEKVYSYNPVPDTLSEDETIHILGTQGNVWTEYMETPDYVEYMVLPRLAALSEVNWSSKKDWELFQKRIQEHFTIYEKLGYNYCDHPF
ncbi:MAG: beta-N-acetylglucosaminidase [Bacteroidetes bacterium]|jgi:hexosaminidase|nr:beta-N-acetylglucosaminidase [Bacteroidota bacterium]